MMEMLNMDGVFAIGVVIQGEICYFDFVCGGIIQGIMDVMLKCDCLILFCVFIDNIEQ